MIKSFFVYLPSTFLMRACAFLTMIAATHLLTPKEFGYFSLILIIGEFTETTTTGWTRLVLTRFGVREAGQLPRSFVARVARISAICAIVGMALSVATVRLLAPENAAAVALAVTLYLAAAVIVRFGITLHQAIQNKRIASTLESIRAVLVLVTAIVAMVATRDFLVASLSLSAINLITGCVALATGLRRTSPSHVDQTPTRVLLWFAFPMIVLAVLSQIGSNLDKALLKSYFDAAVLGYYAAAFAVARNGFDVIAAAFNIETFVRLSSMFNGGRHQEAGNLLSRQMACILAVALPSAGILLASRDIIALVLFPPEYLETFVIVVPWISLGAIVLNIKNCVYDNVLHMHLRNLRQIPSPIAGAAISVTVGLLLVPSRPVFGAAMMFLSNSVAATIVSIGLTRSLMPVPVPWRPVIVSAGIGLAVFGMGEAAIATLDGVLPRVILLGVLAAIGAAGAGLSLLLGQMLVQPKGNGVAISFITPDPDRVTGISSYAESLFEAMARTRERPPLVLVTNARREVFSRIPRSEVEWVSFPACPRAVPYKLYNLIVHDAACWRARLGGCSSYVSTTAAGALFPVVQQFVTLHDLYDVDRRFRPWRTVVYAHLLWRWLAIVSRRIICVSASTAGEARSLLPFAAAKMCIIKEASKFTPGESSGSRDPVRFLFVANIQPNKNVECLLEALRRAGGGLDVDWIGQDPAGIIKSWISRQGEPRGFRSMGSLSDADLGNAYRAAIAVIVPSWKEGFCLPVLEAHALGAPVIAADIPILREVAGHGALFFDPRDPDALIVAMRRLMTDAELRGRLSRAALANAGLYSWDRAATETLQLVEVI